MESILNNQEIYALEEIMIGELDGLNRLVFHGPFSSHLSDEKHTEVAAEKFVIASKNGEVAKLPISQRRTLKDTLWNIFLEMTQGHQSICSLQKSFEGGAIPIGNGLYWLKSETPITYSSIRTQEKPKTIQELRATARKTTFEGFD